MRWLTSRIDMRMPTGRSYFKLLDYLSIIKYYWQSDVPFDENRANDGLELRNLFPPAARAKGSPELDILMGEACTVLEFLIALTERMSFITYDPDGTYGDGYWFWKLLENIGLLEYDDNREFSDRTFRAIDAKISRALDRRYGDDGVGSLFPLVFRAGGWNTVEIWYQMQVYLDQIQAL